MKIIFFLENNQYGGLDTFCSTLINAWPNQTDSFVVVCNASHPGHKLLRATIKQNCEFISHDIPLSWVLSKKYFRWLPSVLRRATQPLLRLILFPFQYQRLKWQFNQLGGDALLVLNGGFPGGETCRIANIAWSALADYDQKKRNIHNFHNYAVVPRLGLQWYENWIDRLLSKSVGRLISVSHSCADSIRIRRTFRSSTAICHIYNGISSTKHDHVHMLPNLRQEFGIGDSPLCLTLANFEPRKGHRFLFEAFALVSAVLPDAHLVACGGGSDEEKKLVNALRWELAPSANIHLLNFVPNGASLIHQVDVVTISSQSFESFGLTAIEAMTRGVPVVSTRIGGLPEVLGEDGKGGVMAAADDPAAYAELIVLLLRDRNLRRKVGEQGKKRASLLFTADRMAAEYHTALVSGADPEVHFTVPTIRGEWYYVMRRCLKPAMVLESFMVVVTALRRRLGNRVLRRREIFYPPQIKSLTAAIAILAARNEIIASAQTTHLPDGPRRLKLAIGYFYFDRWPNWDAHFSDHEQFVSLHRWNWLLRALTDEVKPAGFAWGIALIRSWLLAKTTLPRGDIGESYTTGERIVNACLFARHSTGRWNSLPVDVVKALTSMATDLAHRVEYQEGDLSGNHVINNARALFFAGHCFAHQELLTLGRALILERLPKLIEDGAFLREGSSHYQFLFTRWLLEVRLLAEENGDKETLGVIAPYLPGLVEGCRFFQVKAADGELLIPTLGDVSPDCDLAWLSLLPQSLLACQNNSIRDVPNKVFGWAILFSDYLQVNFEDSQPKRDNLIWRAYNQAGWFRLDFKGWVAIWRLELMGGPAIASHAHHDACSFVLFRHGREVLIDPGRLDYGTDPLGLYGFKGDAHNSVTLNGRPPMLSRGDRLIPELQRKVNCNVSWEESEGTFKVVINHDGFCRLGGGIKNHTRSFIFTGEQLKIVDYFDGHGRYWMEARFHRPLESLDVISPGIYSNLPENLETDISLGMLDAPKGINTRSLVACNYPIGGWRFPTYGIKSTALTQCFSGYLVLPQECSYSITEKSE